MDYEILKPVEDNRCPLLSYIQSEKDLFLKVAKVIKSKDIVFDWFGLIRT
jgi:hypothetical protein